MKASAILRCRGDEDRATQGCRERALTRAIAGRARRGRRPQRAGVRGHLADARPGDAGPPPDGQRAARSCCRGAQPQILNADRAGRASPASRRPARRRARVAPAAAAPVAPAAPAAVAPAAAAPVAPAAAAPVAAAAAAGRSRRRARVPERGGSSLGGVFLLALICWAAAELFVAIKVADAIGVIPMLLLLIAGWPLGLWALRSQGRAAWRRLSDAVAERQTPGAGGPRRRAGAARRRAADRPRVHHRRARLAAPAGAHPGARARLWCVRNLQSRVVVRAARFGGRYAYDVDSTATDIDQPQLHS